ncbi:MAG: hypothetical protein BGO40_03055 [Chryseobacterium sp. 39-10]|nr:DUF2255 family protein [Chryseobacterium sp.]OJV46554.1 MAG: hypothetical protein BGO40_03055 [Chryseobacterium sp. 39-10]
MNNKKSFPFEFYKFLDENTLVEIKSGKNRNKFTEIWMVNVDQRIFARSWNKNENGWMNDFLKNKSGQIKFGEEILNITVKKLESNDELNQKISNAYLEKYTQEHNIEYAKGISQPEYNNYTIEFFIN